MQESLYIHYSQVDLKQHWFFLIERALDFRQVILMQLCMDIKQVILQVVQENFSKLLYITTINPADLNVTAIDRSPTLWACFRAHFYLRISYASNTVSTQDIVSEVGYIPLN